MLPGTDAATRKVVAGRTLPRLSFDALRTGLLASGSLTALLVGGGTPAEAACTVVTGAFTNGAAVSCIVINNASFAGNLANFGTISPGNGSLHGTGIAITNS